YFEKAYEFIKGLDISQLHVFTYSERPGTMALRIDHVVDPKDKHIRSQRILELSEQKQKAFYEAHRGDTRTVLFEQPSKDKPMHGFTDNYIRVEAPYQKELINVITEVKLGEFNEEGDALITTIESK
ncbi:MAG: tRNA (N(6)-L-threonylcarbamoyladenosine(37)-C(2))-methylthiotransferase MtaB, partial [Bacteroidales bacterium]